MMGIDGQVPRHIKVLIAQTKEQDKAKAALVTGSRKIFNDAALAVEKLAGDIHVLGRNSVSASGIMQADLAAIKSLIPRLPQEEAALCQAVLARTGEYMKTLQRLDGISSEIKIDGVSLMAAQIYPEFGEVSGVNKAVNLVMSAIFAEAGVDGKFQDFCESARRRLEGNALVP